jgi:hypothetical protein
LAPCSPNSTNWKARGRVTASIVVAKIDHGALAAKNAMRSFRRDDRHG